jgi:Zn-dependent peptidase ImmA (M78 family)
MPTQWFRDSTGRFSERPFYQQREIEEKALSALRATLGGANADLTWPLSDAALVRFVEFRTDRFDPYADLKHVGIDIDGYTLFSRDGKPSVLINEDLGDERYRYRWRMTLGHELGHVVLHQELYERKSGQLDLIEAPLVPVYCEKSHIIRGTDWCEWQASYFGGALLMPSDVVTARLTAEDPKLLNAVEDGTVLGNRVILKVAKMFEVSRDAARVRLAQLGVVKPVGQRSLNERSA